MQLETKPNDLLLVVAMVFVTLLLLVIGGK